MKKNVWARIMEKTKPNEKGCWIWRGLATRCGYGHIYFRGKMRGVHRVIMHVASPLFDIENSDLLVCHSCDTPLCCNPDHLFTGTRLDNVRDAIRKGRTIRGWPRKKSLSQWKVRQIYDLAWSGRYQIKELAKIYNVRWNIARSIKRGRSWAWLTGHNFVFPTP